YCRKCIGRLLRMEAEGFDEGEEKDRLLAESMASLREAIECFTNSSEFGPTDSEVGECYSLLGRTYLTAGQLAGARDCADRAARLLTDPAAKDYLDLAILRGDLAAAEGDRT